MAVVLVLAIISAKLLAGIYVDYLWYQSLHRGDVFWGMWRSKIFLYVVFAAVFITIAVVNLLIADRLAPTTFAANVHPLVERFHEFFGKRLRLFRIAVAVACGLAVAVPALARWQDWKLFTNSKGFGISDPQFGNDVGFYMFKMPFLTFVIDWLFVAMVIVTVLTVSTHVLSGGIVFAGSRPKVRTATKAHVAVLLAILALVKAADYWVSRYELTADTRGIVRGALYTAVHANLPALTVLALIAVLVAVLYVSTIWTGAWRLPVVASGLWAVMALVGGFIYPAIVQSIIVTPNQADRETTYLERNIDATRHALGLDQVEVRTFTVGTVTAEDLNANTSALSDVRLLNPEEWRERFNTDEGKITGLAINDLDIDRYVYEGRTQQMVVAARELNEATIANKSWQGRHLISTHGCGLVMAPANRVDEKDLPEYMEAELDRPELYFSDTIDGYSIVNTKVAESTCAGSDGTDYQGVGGVQLSSWVRRLAFAVDNMDYNLFGSSAITSDSRVIHVRRVQDRVRKLAPFLSFDGDPYPVSIDGRVKWIVDGYTTSDRYPYAESGDRSQLDDDSGLSEPFNYVRNSVKAVVDAYDGDVTLYAVAAYEQDPVLRVWQSAFPGVIRPSSEMPKGLVEHLRYPEELFRVQTAAYSKYRLDAAQFLERDRAWSVAPAPSIFARTGQVTTPSATAATAASQQNILASDSSIERFVPYYSMFHMPGQIAPTFQLLRPFVPFTVDGRRQELAAFMLASSEPATYGALIAYRIDADPLPDGPTIVAGTTGSDPTIASELNLLNGNEQRVRFGDMQLIPVGGGFVWVRPVYVMPSAAQASYRQVVVGYDGRVAMGRNLEAALSQLFPGFDRDLGDVGGGDAPPVGEPGGSGTGEPTPGDPTPGEPSQPTEPSSAQELLERADVLFDEADAALRTGDLGTYQAKVDEARRLVAEALAIVSPSTTTTTTAPSSAPSPTSTPSDE